MMQTYLQSMTVRLEEWRLKRRDTEEWMRHRQLPEDLRHRVRRFVQYKWLATRGVDEETILHGLPADLRRDIQRHLCLDLVRRVCSEVYSSHLKRAANITVGLPFLVSQIALIKVEPGLYLRIAFPAYPNHLQGFLTSA